MTVGLYVRVDDVDAHFEHATAAGPQIDDGHDDQSYGVRMYATRDPEGHLKWFWSPIAT